MAAVVPLALSVLFRSLRFSELYTGPDVPIPTTFEVFSSVVTFGGYGIGAVMAAIYACGAFRDRTAENRRFRLLVLTVIFGVTADLVLHNAEESVKPATGADGLMIVWDIAFIAVCYGTFEQRAQLRVSSVLPMLVIAMKCGREFITMRSKDFLDMTNSVSAIDFWIGDFALVLFWLCFVIRTSGKKHWDHFVFLPAFCAGYWFAVVATKLIAFVLPQEFVSSVDENLLYEGLLKGLHFAVGIVIGLISLSQAPREAE